MRKLLRWAPLGFSSCECRCFCPQDSPTGLCSPGPCRCFSYLVGATDLLWLPWHWGFSSWPGRNMGGTGQLLPVTQASRNPAANRSLRLACAVSGCDAALLVRLEVSKSSHRLRERPQRARARAGRSRGCAATCQPAGSLLRAPGLVPCQHRAPCPIKAALKPRGCHPQTAAHGHGAAGAAHPAPSCHCCSGNS